MSLLGLFGGAEEQRYAGDSWDIPWGSPMGGGVVNEVTALNLSGVWACETLIADAIATMPVDTYRGNGAEREEITKPDWFERPNEFDTKVDYDTQRVLSLLGWGNAYSFLYRRGDSVDPRAPVVGRRIIDPWRVTVRRSSDGEPSYLVDGVQVARSLIQHIPGYKQPGQVAGMSVISNAAAGLTAGLAAEDLAKNIYENGLNTSGVVEIPSMPAETAAPVVERIAAKIREWYAGSKNAGKPLVLLGGTTWKPMAVTPADAQFLETRQFQIEEIARWFRVPPHMIGQIDKQSSWGTGIEQQSLGFVRYTLMPWIVRLEAADSLLLPPPQYVKYNADALVRADLKTRYEAHEIAIRAGMATPNSRLKLEDEPPVVGGDAVRLPAGVSMVAPGVPFDATTANMIGGLVRSGYDPEDVLRKLGLPAIKHTGLNPVTVQPQDQPGPTPPGDPNGPQ